MELEQIAGTPKQGISVNKHEDHAERIRAALDASLASATRRAYANALRNLERFAAAEQFSDAYSPATIAAHLTDLASRGRSVSAITIEMAAIRMRSLELDVPDPTTNVTLRRTVAGIRRQLAGRPIDKAYALTTGDIGRILSKIDRSTTAGKRDCALITLIYAACLRRSELAALSRGDIRFDGSTGLVVRVRQSKTDQEGAGASVGVTRGQHRNTDPVSALTRWLACRGTVSAGAPLFCRVTRSGAIIDTANLTGGSVAEIIKKRAAAAGLDVPGIRGHSARAGHISQAAKAGVPADQIARTSRHASLSTLYGYIRPVTVLGDTSAASLGL